MHLFESKFLTVLCTIELCLVSSRNKTSKSLLINSCNLNCMQIGSDYGNTWNSGAQDQIFVYFNVNNYPKYWVLQKTNKAFLDFFGNNFWVKYETFLSTALSKNSHLGFLRGPGGFGCTLSVTNICAQRSLRSRSISNPS